MNSEQLMQELMRTPKEKLIQMIFQLLELSQEQNEELKKFLRL